MVQLSLLARSGLWRVSRHDYVREVYHKLAAAGVSIAQLDRFERPTAPLDTPAPTLEETTLDVVPAMEDCPPQLSDIPLAPSDSIIRARRNGRTIGWCSLSDRPVYVPELRRPLTFPGSYLWRLYVSPSERGRGVGTALIHRAVGHSRTVLNTETVTALVAPDNLPSRKAFERLGFTPTERFTSAYCLGREWHRHTSIE